MNSSLPPEPPDDGRADTADLAVAIFLLSFAWAAAGWSATLRPLGIGAVAILGGLLWL